MKFTVKGIGWLIVGVIVCLSAFEADDISGAVSSILLGAAFITIYLMKQKFSPVGIGWFVAAGFFAAFTVDMFLDVIRGVTSGGSGMRSDLSSMVFGGLLTALFVYMFYNKNKEEIEDTASDMDIGDQNPFPNQEEVFGEFTEGYDDPGTGGGQDETASDENVPAAEFVVEDSNEETELVRDN